MFQAQIRILSIAAGLPLHLEVGIFCRDYFARLVQSDITFRLRYVILKFLEFKYAASS
jgi:hypothetical protein